MINVVPVVVMAPLGCGESESISQETGNATLVLPRQFWGTEYIWMFYNDVLQWISDYTSVCDNKLSRLLPGVKD